MSEWRPIETAPKDGSAILVFAPVDGVISSWYKWGCWQRLTQTHPESNEPTHWMPLPPPPEDV